jgi:DNA-binding SARP family transcriptional activator
VFAYAALARTGRGNTEQFAELVTAAHRRTGLAVNLLTHEERSSEPASRPAVSIRCFGEFGMTINGRQLAMGSMKPRTRALLRRLCVDAGAPIHREVLQEALWPNTDPDAASRNLQVAISSLRHALEPGVARGASSMIVRDGNTYRLALPSEADVDVQAFDGALELSRRARVAGDDRAALEAFERAVRIGRKELLPEDGSAEWVVERRTGLRAAIADASRALAARLLSATQPDNAARVASAGLEADRYDDGLWRLLIEARERAGDAAATRRAQSDYRNMLQELAAPTRS